MEFVTDSIVNSEFNYQHEEENQTLDIQDKGKKSDLYKIDIFGKNYIISLGNKKIHPKNNNLVYFVVYLMQKAERIEDISVVTKIGVYERFIDSENEISDLSISDFEIEKLNIVLFQKFYVQRYLFANLEVSDEDINILEENKSIRNTTSGNNEPEQKENLEDDIEDDIEEEQEFDVDDLEEEVKAEEKKEEIPNTATSIVKIGENILFEKHDIERSSFEMKQILDMEFDILFKKTFRTKSGISPIIRNVWKAMVQINDALIQSGIVNEDSKEINIQIRNNIENFYNFIKTDIIKITPFALFNIELAYGIKFIIIEDNKINKFEVIDGIHEQDFTKIQDKILRIVLKEDPKYFVFLNKNSENNYEHVMVYNNNNSYVNYVTLDDMTNETRELIINLFRSFMTKNKSLIYNYDYKNDKDKKKHIGHYKLLRDML